MISTHVCQTCGNTHASEGNDGFCPACMLRSALGDPADDSSFPLTPGALPSSFGPYQLIEEIARGGMGVVYKARQTALNRIVALKVLVGGAYSSESLLRRFQTEAEAAAALQHPGIVAIHEFGEYDNQPYYTMDYVEGQNLSTVASGQPLAPARAARYLQAVAEAVGFAHQQGILHRDLKPSNILIDQNDQPRVADFGLAKRLHDHSDATLTGQMLGSPNYAPPEQAAGRQDAVGVRSDVYSLGGLLYYLLTGRPPFLAGTVQETLRLVFEIEPVSPRALNPAVPRDLETVVLKCLEKDPGRRYASAQDLADELARFQRDEPILARPVMPPELAWRWCARHPAITGLAATVVLALATTSTVFYTSARRIERARALEHTARARAEENLYAVTMLRLGQGFGPLGGADFRELELSGPAAIGRDLRGFEWRYYWTTIRADALTTLKGHQHVVDAAFFSPSGSLIVTHSHDDNLKLWDAATMKELQSYENVHHVGGFTSDGAQLIFSRPDNSIWRLDLSTHRALAVRGPGGRLIAAQPDGRVVVFGKDQLPVVQALADGASSEFLDQVPANACAVVSADGRRAAVANPRTRGMIVVDLATQAQLASFDDRLGPEGLPSRPPRFVTALALSPDGRRLVSAGYDGVLKVWDVDRGKMEREFNAFVDPVLGVTYSPDGRFLAAGGSNRVIQIWQTSSWEKTTELRGHEGTVRCIAFSPDGQRLVSGGQDELAVIWPSQVNRPTTEMRQLLRGPRYFDRTPGLAFSPDGRLFAGTAVDNAIKVWRTDTIECIATFPMDARTVAFSPDGSAVLGATEEGIVRQWELNGREVEPAKKPAARFTNWQKDPLTSQKRVALVTEQVESDVQCRLCEIPSTRDGIFGGAMSTTQSIAVSPDGKRMFVGLPTGGMEIWELTSRRRTHTIPAHKLAVTALAVSPDGRYLASGSLDNSTRLWDTATGERLAVFGGHNRPVWALAFSPDGQTLAAGSCDKQIVLCSVPMRRQVAMLPMYVGTPAGYEQEVRLLRFSPDGNILAAALGDGTLRFFRAEPFSVTDRNTIPRRRMSNGDSNATDIGSSQP